MKRSLVAVTATLAAVALAGFVVSPAFGGPGFLTLARAKKVFVTKASAKAYLTKEEAAASYLGQADAGSTYLSKAEAGSTYLDKGAAESTYLSKGEAGTTYLGKADAEKAYVGKAEADSKYLPAAASSTFQVSPGNWVASTGGSITYVANVSLFTVTSGNPVFIAATTLPSELQGRPVSVTGMELCLEVPLGSTVTLVMLAVGNAQPVFDETTHTSGGCLTYKLPSPFPIGPNGVQVALKGSTGGGPLVVGQLSLQVVD